MVVCEKCGIKMKPIYKNMSRREQIMFYRCSNCGLLWAPKLDVDSSFQSKLDENNRQVALESVRRKEFTQVNNLIEKYVPKGGRGLDVGCSYGWYMRSVNSDYEIEGIEPEEAVALKACENGCKVYTGFFPKDMPKDLMPYDFLVFNNVWEHINHTTELIKGSLAVLRKGGYLIITVPLSSGGLYKISEIFEKFGRTNELARLWQLHFHSPHVYYFSKKNFVELMKKYNCSLMECQDVRGIDPRKMRERFEMDMDEKHANLKAKLFQIVYPFLKLFPADKAVFVFCYNG